jgi:hypothetical protein
MEKERMRFHQLDEICKEAVLDDDPDDDPDNEDGDELGDLLEMTYGFGQSIITIGWCVAFYYIIVIVVSSSSGRLGQRDRGRRKIGRFGRKVRYVPHCFIIRERLWIDHGVRIAATTAVILLLLIVSILYVPFVTFDRVGRTHRRRIRIVVVVLSRFRYAPHLICGNDDRDAATAASSRRRFGLCRRLGGGGSVGRGMATG